MSPLIRLRAPAAAITPVKPLHVTINPGERDCFTPAVRYGYNGIFPCFFRGMLSTLFSSMRSARITRGRVSCGSITSST